MLNAASAPSISSAAAIFFVLKLPLGITIPQFWQTLLKQTKDFVA